MSPGADTAWSDERIDRIIGNLLRIGVLLATGFVAVAGVAYLFHHGGEPADYHHFQRDPEYASLSGIFRAAVVPRWRAVIQIGLLLLIATPVARVVFSVAAFAAQRDWLYMTITLLVLAVLLYGMFCGVG
jgi:uncharacterized membrane protein